MKTYKKINNKIYLINFLFLYFLLLICFPITIRAACAQGPDILILLKNGVQINESNFLIAHKNQNTDEIYVESICINGVCHSSMARENESLLLPLLIEIKNADTQQKIEKLIIEVETKIQSENKNIKNFPDDFYYYTDSSFIHSINGSKYENLLSDIVTDGKYHTFPNLSVVPNHFNHLNCSYKRIIKYDTKTKQLTFSQKGDGYREDPTKLQIGQYLSKNIWIIVVTTIIALIICILYLYNFIIKKRRKNNRK